MTAPWHDQLDEVGKETISQIVNMCSLTVNLSLWIVEQLTFHGADIHLARFLCVKISACRLLTSLKFHITGTPTIRLTAF